MAWTHCLRRRAALALSASLVASATAAQPAARRLADLTLEELSNLEVTSVSKRAERLSDAPASVFVITADDIRRSGATSLPEALRLAPNVQVARVGANGWAITARGFNSNSANKLLVLIDGRSVYSPLFSGVFWDVQELLLDDIERIEVVSGPGGTLWGVNAVNGVINVTTRAAGQTAGNLASVGGGNKEAALALRHGGELGDGASYRIYAKRVNRHHTQTASGAEVNDASQTTQLGFRADAARGSDTFTLQGDVYTGRRNQPPPGSFSVAGVTLALDTISVSGGNLIARWERKLADDASLSATFTYDRVERTVPPTFAETLDIADLQLQHAWRPAPAHQLVWGAEYRHALDRVDNSTIVAFLPGRLQQTWGALFAQDEITLLPEWRLTLGARVERNPYTGSEFLPSLRLAWKVRPEHLLWGALSRTVRAPSRLDRDAFVPGQPPFKLFGGPDFQSEIAKVAELGYRGQPTASSSLTVTVFRAEYDKLHSQELGPTGKTVFFGNNIEGTLRGLEAWGSVQATPSWRLHAGYLRLLQDLQLKPGSRDVFGSVATAVGANPGHQWLLRSALDLPRQTELDVTVRHVSALTTPLVPAYTAVDLRWGWRPNANSELSVTAQNLFDPGHGEFTSVTTRTEFGRALFVRWTTRF